MSISVGGATGFSNSAQWRSPATTPSPAKSNFTPTDSSATSATNPLALAAVDGIEVNLPNGFSVGVFRISQSPRQAQGATTLAIPRRCCSRSSNSLQPSRTPREMARPRRVRKAPRLPRTWRRASPWMEWMSACQTGIPPRCITSIKQAEGRQPPAAEAPTRKWSMSWNNSPQTYRHIPRPPPVPTTRPQPVHRLTRQTSIPSPDPTQQPADILISPGGAPASARRAVRLLPGSILRFRRDERSARDGSPSLRRSWHPYVWP